MRGVPAGVPPVRVPRRCCCSGDALAPQIAPPEVDEHRKGYAPVKSFMRSRCSTLCGSLALILLVRGAAADETRALSDALTVDDTQCIDREALAAETAAVIGSGSLDTRIAVAVHHEPGTLAFRITREGTVVGERSFGDAGMTCKRMTQALAVALAVSLDATILERLGAAPKRKEAQIATPEPPPIVAAPPRSERPRVAAPPLHASLSIRAAMLGLAGVLPRPSLGFEVGASYRFARVPVEVGLAAFGTKTNDVAFAGGRLDVGLIAAKARACIAAHYGRIRPAACGGVAGGAMSGQGFGFAPGFSRTNPWIAGVGGLEVGFRVVTWLEIAMILDAAVPFAAPRYDVVDGTGLTIASERASPIGGTLGLAVGLVL